MENHHFKILQTLIKYNNEEKIISFLDKNPIYINTIYSNNTTLLIIAIENKYNCKYCDIKFTRKDSLKKHNNRCKNRNNSLNILQEKNNILEKQIKHQTEEINEMKSILSEIINKKAKIHPKTLHKINKQLNINNTTNNYLNNTIHNTFLIALGHENLTEIFSKKEKINILKNRYNSLPFLVEYAHFNDKYPQFKNILITNTQNNLAYKFDNKKKQFIAIDKNELLEDIVNERMYDINSFYDELEGELEPRTKDIIDKVKEKIDNDPEFRELKKKDIKLIIYNNRQKVSKEIIKDIEI